MRRPSGLTRLLWRMTALLQFLMPPVVSTADAQVEGEAMSRRAFTHVESTTGQDCARTHQVECALCQHLTTPLTKPDKPAPPLMVTRAEPRVSRACAGQLTSRHRRPTLPRAPPAR